jgi:hypothetical protein
MFANLPHQLILLTIASLSTAQTVTYSNYDDAMAAVSRVSTYTSYIAAQPQFTSVVKLLESVIPDSEFENLVDPTVSVGAYTTASWYSALPTDVKSYLSSITVQEMKLATATGNAAAPTGVGRGVVGMGVGVAGILGAALAL